MTDKRSKDREFILNVIDDFVEDIISKSSTDVIDNEEYNNIPDKELLEIQKKITNIAKKAKLLEIREEINKSNKDTATNVVQLSSAQKQRAYKKVLSNQNLTLAARNEDNMSTKDDEYAFIALQELGLVDDEDSDQ
tara:strand:+ start:3986 stop:4393 length:408 start_codon:yes stop_codon:yes gene_type:complete